MQLAKGTRVDRALVRVGSLFGFLVSWLVGLLPAAAAA